MNISEELIRELQRKIDISYEEAEYYLKKAKGDVNLAFFIIMKKRDSSWERFKATLIDLLKYRFIMTRRGETLINLPLLLLVLFIFFYGIQQHLFPLVLIVIIALLTECEVKIYKLKPVQEQEDNQTRSETRKPCMWSHKPIRPTSPEKPNPTVKQATTKPTKETENQQPLNKADGADNDYYEIVIEE